MQVRSLPVGPLLTNCFVVWDEPSKQAMIIDPGGDADRILGLVQAEGLTVCLLVNTHGHADHILANSRLREQTGAPLCIHELDAPMLTDSMANLSAWAGLPYRAAPPDRLLREGDELAVGALTFRVLHTPGHTPGGISLVGPGCVFSGDCLFEGSIGRTDFPGGNHRLLIQSIREKLLALPDDTVVYSGHGPQTTIGQERATNPFL